MFCCLYVSQPLEISMCLRCRFLPRFCLLSSCVTFKFTRISEKQHSSHQRALQLPSHSHSLIHTEMDKSSGTACFLSFLNISALSVLCSSAQSSLSAFDLKRIYIIFIYFFQKYIISTVKEILS